MKKETTEAFEKACEPLFKFLREHHDFHTTVILTSTSAEVVQSLYNHLPEEAEDRPKHNQKLDSKLVSSEDHELDTWSKKFGAYPDGIRVAKIMVGESANSIEEYIAEKRHEGRDIVVPFSKLFLPKTEE